MRASRNLRATESLGRPETEESPRDQAWKGACGAGAATGGPSWLAQLAPQLTGPSVRKLKVSYVRAGARSGVLGPGGPPPAERRPPSRSGQRCGGPGRSKRAGQGGAGVRGGTWGRSTLQRPARGDLTRDPPPQAGRDRAGPPTASVQPRTELPDPSPLARAPPRTPNFETSRPLWTPVLGPGPREPSSPDP
ncbi:basic salivary proline-rich protein 3-like [Eumetopias jubatus]|uniref:basic salivary proline-rich protein 3-like n=1 Tax=Eumetopias jubatus TaxID=34886 RepID=UPI00101639A2|nr:basic salivary proline-rich protein 3-like [Eumetopias jubatus]